MTLTRCVAGIERSLKQQLISSGIHMCGKKKENGYNTLYRYNYKQLEVHHIIPIEEDETKK